MLRSLFTALLCLSLCAIVPQQARGAGFAAPHVGPTRAGVTTADAASVHFNPAGLGFVTEAAMLGGANLVIGDLHYQRERLATYQYADSLDFSLPIDPLNIDTAKSGEDVSIETQPIGAVPTAFFALPLSGLPLAVGAGMYLPYVARVAFDAQGPQRHQLIEATLGAVFFTPSIAYRPMERLALGLGVSYVFGFANLSKVQDLATLRDLGEALSRPPINQQNAFGPDADPAVRELDTLSRPFVFKEGRAHGFTFNAGFTAEPVDHLFVAASYEHTAKLVFKGDFTLDMDDPFFTQDLSSQGLQYPALVRGRASLGFTLPRVVRLGVRYAFGKPIDGEPRSDAALEGSFTGWSSIDDFDVRTRSKDLAQPELGLPATASFSLPRRWRDTYGGVVRLSHKLSSDFMAFGLVGYETGASPLSTIDVASPDGHRLSFAAGLAQRLSHAARLILDVNVQQVLPREVKRSDYDLANGTYEMRIVSLGAHAEYSF